MMPKRVKRFSDDIMLEHILIGGRAESEQKPST